MRNSTWIGLLLVWQKESVFCLVDNKLLMYTVCSRWPMRTEGNWTRYSSLKRILSRGFSAVNTVIPINWLNLQNVLQNLIDAAKRGSTSDVKVIYPNLDYSCTALHYWATKAFSFVGLAVHCQIHFLLLDVSVTIMLCEQWGGDIVPRQKWTVF